MALHNGIAVHLGFVKTMNKIMEDILYRIKHNCPLLVHANLSNTNITDKAAFQLAKALETNTSLQTLHLYNTSLGDKSRQILTKTATTRGIALYFVKNFRAVDGENVVYHIHNDLYK